MKLFDESFRIMGLERTTFIIFVVVLLAVLLAVLYFLLGFEKVKPGTVVIVKRFRKFKVYNEGSHIIYYPFQKNVCEIQVEPKTYGNQVESMFLRGKKPHIVTYSFTYNVVDPIEYYQNYDQIINELKVHFATILCDVFSTRILSNATDELKKITTACKRTLLKENSILGSIKITDLKIEIK